MSRILLDGKEVTLEVLQEAKKNRSVRIIEISPGEFKTLQKLKD